MNDEKIDESKRRFLKMVSIGSAVVAFAGFVPSLSYLIPRSVGLTSFPTLTLVKPDRTPIHTRDILPNTAKIVLFQYPLSNEPSFLLNLNKSVPGGLGPKNSVVAYSAICQHLGCIPPSIKYYPPGSKETKGYKVGGYIHCACHGSTYDPSDKAKIITGPTNYPLPMVELSYDSIADTYKATKMGKPVIYGKKDWPNGSLDNDLRGGDPIKYKKKPTSKTDVYILTKTS